MKTLTYHNLSAWDKALVAVAVLIDGREAGKILSLDAENPDLLRDAADELAAHDPELRMPLVGTQLRASLQKIKEGRKVS